MRTGYLLNSSNIPPLNSALAPHGFVDSITYKELSPNQRHISATSAPRAPLVSVGYRENQRPTAARISPAVWRSGADLGGKAPTLFRRPSRPTWPAIGLEFDHGGSAGGQPLDGSAHPLSLASG